jgi:hypothetical protein
MGPVTGIGIMLSGIVYVLYDGLRLFQEGFDHGSPPQFDVRAMLFALLFGLMLILVGQLTFQAAHTMDPVVFRIVGWYLLGASILVAAGRGPFGFILALDSAAALGAGYSPAWGSISFNVPQIFPFAVLGLSFFLRSNRGQPRAHAA